MTKHTPPRTVKDMRLVGVVRLSKDDPDTTSPERQQLAMEQYAAFKGHRIIGWAMDIDVKGKVPPEERPELGPWLRRPNEWDGLIAHKPDRLGRNLRDFLNFCYDLDEKGKTLIVIDPELDMSKKEGRLLAHMMLSFAEFEWETISGRVKEAHRHIKVNGGYPGGQVPFGYLAVKRDGKGWGYEHDPEYAPVVRKMVERIIRDGESMRSVAMWLNAAGIPTSHNALRRRNGKPERPSEWSAAQVKKVLLSPAICGMQAENGKPMRDGEDDLVARCDGIITRQEWEQVKKAITGPAHRTYRTDANPLLGIGFCFLCGSQLYTSKVSSRGSTWSYYRCSKGNKDSTCEAMMLPADWLNEQAAEIFLAQCGDLEWGYWDTSSAEDHEHELTILKQELADLDDEYTAGRLHATTYARITRRLEERREALENTPTVPQEPVWVGSGETYRQRWQRIEPGQRSKEMRHAGFAVYVAKTKHGIDIGFQVREYDPRVKADQAPLGVPTGGTTVSADSVDELLAKLDQL